VQSANGCHRNSELKNAGWITVEGSKGGSPTHTNRYSFDFKRVKSASPLTGAEFALVQDSSKLVQTSAHEPSRTTRAFRREEREEISCQRAPDGALEEKFEQLCAAWPRPYGTNKARALKAFMAVCGEHDADAVLASAHNWIAVKAARWFPKLEEWLGNGAWLQEPPPDVAAQSRRPGGKANPVDEMLNAGGMRRNG
jgi:hypothetical protein